MNENPYNPLEPTKDPTHFFGRQDALAFLQLQLVSTVNPKALVILGQRGIGKSSLLAQVPLQVDERYPTVTIDISTLELDDPVGLVAAIVDHTRNTMEAIEASTYRLPPFPDPTDPQTNLLEWLASDYLEVVMKAIWQERHLVLMLDNAHLIFDAVESGAFPEDFIGYLAHLLALYPRLNLIVTLDIGYETRALQTPPFDDSKLHYRLMHLSRDKAMQIIQEPVKGQYEILPAAQERILELAGGHPFHLHSICRLLYRLHDERNLEHITPHEIEAIYPAALEQAEDIVKPLWESMQTAERLVLTALMDIRQHNPDETAIPPDAVQNWLRETDYVLNDIQLAATWRRLEYQGIVQTDVDGNYQFAAGIQADWLLRQGDFDQAGEDEKTETNIQIPWSIVAVTAIVLLVIVSGFLLGVFDGDDETDAPDERARPTATFEVDIESAEQTAIPLQTQTAGAAEQTPLPLFKFGG
jgi:hypothetical protein